MARRRKTARSIALLGAAALAVAGCGGGDPAPVPTDASATPAPGAGTDTVGAQPTVDLDGDGIPDVDADGDGIKDPPAPAELGATATIPDLSGGDIGGGLGSIGSAAPLFEANAITVQALEEERSAKRQDQAMSGVGTAPRDPLGGGGSITGTTGSSGSSATPKPKPTYTAAKVYIDGIVHDVAKGAAFPKDNPVFRLLQVNGGSIEVELIAGEFTTGGGSGVVLDKGELVSLVNASEQLTYRVKFLRATEGSNAVTF